MPTAIKRTYKVKELDDLTITYYKQDEPHKTLRKAIQWVKRFVIANRFDCSTTESAYEAIEYVNGPYQQLDILSYEDEGVSEKDYAYFSNLLRIYCKKGKLTVAEFQHQGVPFLLERKNLSHTVKAWVAGNCSNPSHGVEGQLVDEGYDYHLMLDFHYVLAETLVLNEFYRFMTNYRLEWQEKLAEMLYLFYGKKHEIHIPTKDKEMQEFLIQYVKRAYPNRDITPVKHKDMDYHVRGFHLEKMTYPNLQKEYFPLYLKQFKGVKTGSFKHHISRVHREKNVYETNRNIRPHIRQLMKDNEFLGHFGEVEIHNDLSVDVFHQMEEAFKLFCSYVPLPSTEGRSVLRFKKLGKQNAFGLYYPDRLNILVDIRRIHVFTHEIGHYIDYEWEPGERRSEQPAFVPLYEEYCRLITEGIEACPLTHPSRKNWEKRNGYNREYYLRKKEAFARMFEIFVSEVVPHTMLSKPSLNSYLFPDSHSFREDVVTYFVDLLNISETLIMRSTGKLV